MSQTTLVDADHFQFLIGDLGGAGLDTPHRPDDRLLVRAEPEWLSVITGVQYGDVSITGESHASRPEADDGEWDDVVELSVVTANGLCVGELMADPNVMCLVDEGGSYRIRIHARGRDIGASWFDGSGGPEGEDAEDDDEVVEFYLIQVWAEPSSPAAAIKLTSSCALNWGNE